MPRRGRRSREAAHVDAADAPLVVGSRAYSESVAAGHVIAQTPPPASRVERAALDLVVRVSRGTAVAIVPDVEGATQKEATAALRRVGFAVSVRPEESWEVPEGRVVSSDVAAGDEARRPGPIGIVVSSGPPRAPVPDVRGVAVDDAVARLDGSFETDVVEEGSETAAAGSVLRQSPDPGTRAVLGSTVTLTVARAPEWATTWSQSGSGSYDSDAVEVTASQGNWRIVVEVHPRYLIFGSGSAARVVGGDRGGPDRPRRGGLRRGRTAQRRRLLPVARASAGQRQLDRARRATRLGERDGASEPASASSAGRPPGTTRCMRRRQTRSAASLPPGRSSSSPAAARSG